MSVFFVRSFSAISHCPILVVNCAGILLVTGVGVALGVSVGVIVLFTVLFCFRRSGSHTVVTS